MTLVCYGFSTLSCAHENVHQWSPLMLRYTKDSKRSVLSLVILAVQPNSRKYHALVPNIPETENVHQWSPLFTSDLPWWHMLYLLCNQIRGSTMLLYQIFQSDLPWCHMSWHRLHGFQLLNVSVSTAQSGVLSLSLSNSLSLLSIRPSVCLSLSD